MYLRHLVENEECLSLDVNGYLVTNLHASVKNIITPIDVI